MELDNGLIGHWKLRDDCKDTSDNAHASQGCDVELGLPGPGGHLAKAAGFNGCTSQIEVADAESLDLGSGDFSITAWVHTEKDMSDVIGDILSKYDPAARRGFNLNVVSLAGVTSTHANERNLHFGIDNGRMDSEWTNCGQLGAAMHVPSLCVFDNALYAGTCEWEADGAGHVWRYTGGDQWEDCGSPATCNSVAGMAVYDGALYCGVARYESKGSCLPSSPNENPGGKIFRYAGNKKWIDCGQIDDGQASHCTMVVFDGKLYAAPTYKRQIHVYEGGRNWRAIGPDVPIMSMGCWNGGLYAMTGASAATATGINDIYRMDTSGQWESLGHPHGSRQNYSFVVHNGRPWVGTWPAGDIFRYDDPNTWTHMGSPGYSKEAMGMALYNGKLYAGILPMAQVYRHEEGRRWTFVGEVDSTPNHILRRAWSMAVFNGKLYCGTLPAGHVMSLEAGKMATVDRSLEPGWRHLAAVRENNRLSVMIDGEVCAQSDEFSPADYELGNNRPMHIGFGTHDHFNGRICDLRLYNRALTIGEITTLAHAAS